MVTKNIIEDSILSGLADKIREKLGVTDTFLPSAMADKIGEISAGEGVYAWKRTDSSGNFVDYVTDDDEAAYPESGEHTDGYTYEKIAQEVLLYVWNKYETKTTTTNTNISITGISPSYSQEIGLTVSPAGSTLKKEDFYGWKLYNAQRTDPNDDTMYIQLNSDGTWGWYIWYALQESGEWEYYPEYNVIYFGFDVSNSFSGTKTVTRTNTTTTTNKLGEVTSEDRNTYPDTTSTKHTDGYYYEYVGERITEI